MNSISQGQIPVIRQTVALRHQLFDLLSEADLDFTLPGNPSIRDLLVELAHVQAGYVESFRSFQHDYGYRGETPGAGLDGLKAAFNRIDAEMETVLSGLSEADIQGRMVDRGFGLMFPVVVQVQVYREAMLITFSKISVYLRALEKPFPQQWELWIG